MESPTPERKRAFLRGAGALVAIPLWAFGLVMLANAVGAGADPHSKGGFGLPLLLVVPALGGTIYSAWQLGKARALRWDPLGVVSLLLMVAGSYPLLFILLGGLVMMLYVLITGQPLQMFSN